MGELAIGIIGRIVPALDNARTTMLYVMSKRLNTLAHRRAWGWAGCCTRCWRGCTLGNGERYSRAPPPRQNSAGNDRKHGKGDGGGRYNADSGYDTGTAASGSAPLLPLWWYCVCMRVCARACA